jgi:aerobic carbon-monoxide dehydrogenase small subunit
LRSGKSMESKRIKFVINGQSVEIQVKPWRTLLEMIREDLKLTGTKEGCGHGECGSCTVIMGGKTVNSCLVPALEADGQEIMTIEGLSKGRGLNPIQEAFVERSGMQCGFCTPGMIVSAKALLDRILTPVKRRLGRPWQATFAGARATRKSSNPSEQPQRRCGKRSRVWMSSL